LEEERAGKWDWRVLRFFGFAFTSGAFNVRQALVPPTEFP
jgi:hypothetical protein